MERIEAWSDFNVALAGATAALAGLLIVAASVNIGAIIKERSLTARLAAAVSGLALALVGSALGLIPEIDGVAYGVSMIVLAAVAAVFQAQAARLIFANHHPANRLRPLKASVGWIAPLAYLVGGVLVAAGSGAGLVWFAVGAIVAIVAGLLVSWVVLVEVLR